MAEKNRVERVRIKLQSYFDSQFFKIIHNLKFDSNFLVKEFLDGYQLRQTDLSPTKEQSDFLIIPFERDSTRKMSMFSKGSDFDAGKRTISQLIPDNSDELIRRSSLRSETSDLLDFTSMKMLELEADIEEEILEETQESSPEGVERLEGIATEYINTMIDRISV